MNEPSTTRICVKELLEEEKVVVETHDAGNRHRLPQSKRFWNFATDQTPTITKAQQLRFAIATNN